MAARLLIVCDSHTREIHLAINKIMPSCRTFTVSVGRDLDKIILKYHVLFHHIKRFRPTHLIIHAGHNDIVRHHIYNLNPLNPRVFTRDMLHFINEIIADHPTIKPYTSSIFPRTYTDHSYLSPTDVVSYNRKCKRHGEHLVTTTRNTNTHVLLNNCLWLHINSSVENSTPFDHDGLHLTKDGQLTVAKEWLSCLFPDLFPVQPTPV